GKADLVATEGARSDGAPGGPRAGPRARRKGAALPHVRLRQGGQGGSERRHVRRGVRRDGHREGHRLFQPLRTSYDPIFWQGPHRVHASQEDRDRKSTRLNSSHGSISYAVFCLKKKNTLTNNSPFR